MNDKQKQLDLLKKELESKVDQMPLLKKPEDIVFGEGDPNASIVFIGEAAGYWEAKLRRPFVGSAGKLLNQLFKDSDLKRDKVYITNVVKTRPPSNRDPLPEEIEAFKPYLDQEIQIIEPKIIVTLGRFSMNKFLPGEKISRIHGQARYIDFLGKRYIVVPMYHPAAALRSGKIMEEIKKDFQKIKQFLEENPEEEIIEEKKEDKQLKLV